MGSSDHRTPAILAGLAVLGIMVGALTTASGAFAENFRLGPLSIEQPWARASAGPLRSGAAFLTIRNSGTSDRLTAVAGSVAEKVELHTHLMDGDVMKMRPVEAAEVPPEGSVTLQPGGLHIMLIGLVAPLKEGESFPLTLSFETAGEVTVEVSVLPVGSMGPPDRQDAAPDHGDHMNHGAAPSDH